MMIKMEITGLKSLQRMLMATSKEIDRATGMALNKVASKAKTEMKRAISSEFMITQRDVAKELRIKKAYKGHPVAILYPARQRHRSLNLIRFLEKKPGIREQKRRARTEGARPQLRFHIKRGGGAKTIKGAFIGNRGRTVFKRTGKGRLPIKAVQTLGIQGMFNTKRINKRVIARIRKELPIEMDSAIAQVIRKRFK